MRQNQMVQAMTIRSNKTSFRNYVVNIKFASKEHNYSAKV